MGLFSFLDEDNDGTSFDDNARRVTSAAGGALMLGGTAVGGLGASILASSLVADATGVGAVLGLPAGVAGGLMMGGGALMGAGGMALESDLAQGAAEEVGDFSADVVGARDVDDRRDPLEPIGDDHYRHLAEGNGTPGYGQQLHDWLTEPSEDNSDPMEGVTPVMPEEVPIPAELPRGIDPPPIPDGIDPPDWAIEEAARNGR